MKCNISFYRNCVQHCSIQSGKLVGLSGVLDIETKNDNYRLRKIGRKFTEVFSEGHDIGVSSNRNVVEQGNELGAHQIDDFEKAIKSSDYIFNAVPINALDPVIEKINNYISPEIWAFYMCSARVKAREKWIG